jgi:hypothetical protein
MTSQPEPRHHLAQRGVGQDLGAQLFDVRRQLGDRRPGAIQLVSRERTAGDGPLDLAPYQCDQAAPVRGRGGQQLLRKVLHLRLDGAARPAAPGETAREGQQRGRGLGGSGP